MAIRERVGDDGEALVAQLLRIANHRGSTWGRVQAIRELLDRGWGKAPQEIKVEATKPTTFDYRPATNEELVEVRAHYAAIQVIQQRITQRALDAASKNEPQG